ncbi:hypothetical protein [Lentzea cavernae]|uniref:Uncharacterized protein n=1 Tax=Lentzea cavernae TaxID=2020703 RepID=A0ABQ3N0Q8_9PSEU|nr:hypothetical protein [Lentzea cavernae]GHH57443.1 hypothetical protein GCM10017774_76940 [Lentzea cavernae]
MSHKNRFGDDENDELTSDPPAPVVPPLAEGPRECSKCAKGWIDREKAVPCLDCRPHLAEGRRVQLGLQ